MSIGCFSQKRKKNGNSDACLIKHCTLMIYNKNINLHCIFINISLTLYQKEEMYCRRTVWTATCNVVSCSALI